MVETAVSRFPRPMLARQVRAAAAACCDPLEFSCGTGRSQAARREAGALLAGPHQGPDAPVAPGAASQP